MTRRMSGKRIVVVEDDETLNAMLSNQLKQLGCQVVQARTWEQAERALEQEDPSLALLDIRG